MALVDGLPGEILEAVAARLRTQLAIDSTKCFISDNPDAEPPSAAEIYYVVSPAVKGSFDASMFSGGAQSLTTVNTMIVITIHRSSQRDEAERGNEMFAHETDGLFVLARPVIKALAGWAPTNASSNINVNQPLFPDNYSVFRNSRDSSSFQVAFHVQFDWDLS